jgi:PhnB protein
MSTQAKLNHYLTFNGNCREAMNFYKECLGGTLEIFTYEGTTLEDHAQDKNNVMHSTLTSGDMVIMGADSMINHSASTGNNVSLSINCTSREELDNYFEKLGAGGKITMSKQDTAWDAYFGMIIDKFGVNWMFNYDEPKQ